MQRTRRSFWFVAAYLALFGLGFLLAPERVLVQTGSLFHDAALVRVVGMFMLGLCVLVVEMIRHDLWPLYRASLVVRASFVVILVALHVANGDRLFLWMAVIVAIGVAITGLAYLKDRRSRA